MIKRFQELQRIYQEQAARYQENSPLRRIYRDAHVKGGTLRAPMVVMLDLTNMCNINCTFCYRSGPAALMPKGDARYLSLQRLDELCAQFSEMGVASITLSGGEPTCHPQFVEAVALVKKWDFSITVVTNGTFLTKENIKAVSRLFDPCRDKFELSFNAAGGETFKRIVRSGRYADFRNTLLWFKQYKIPFVTMTLVLKDNLGEIEQILHMAAGHGARECAVEAPFPKNHMEAVLYASLDQVFDIYERLLDREQEHPFIVLSFFHLLEHIQRQNQQGSEPVASEHGCHAGEASCAIDIHGNVHLCQFVIDNEVTKLGNIAEKPFSEIWTDAQNKKHQLDQRRHKHGGCPAFEWESDQINILDQPIAHELVIRG